MLSLAESYVKEHSITFSTNEDPMKSKSKGISFSSSPIKTEPEQLKLNGNSLPWVSNAKYLGKRLKQLQLAL